MLSEKQILSISELLRNNGLKYIDLNHEVTDHLACDTEVLMKETQMDFDVSFSQVRKAFLKRNELWDFGEFQKRKLKESRKYITRMVYKDLFKWFYKPLKLPVSIGLTIIFYFLLQYTNPVFVFKAWVIIILASYLLSFGFKLVNYKATYKTLKGSSVSHLQGSLSLVNLIIFIPLLLDDSKNLSFVDTPVLSAVVMMIVSVLACIEVGFLRRNKNELDNMLKKIV